MNQFSELFLELKFWSYLEATEKQFIDPISGDVNVKLKI